MLVTDSKRVMGRSAAVGIKVVDTTGAGDSYIAAFLAARVTGADVSQAMAAGSASAALTCMHRGAWPQPPMPLRPPARR